MPEVCGRVCPHSELCEGACVYAHQGRPAVAIGRLEAFAADFAARATAPAPAAAPVSSGKSVAVVGAGPAGLAVAGSLARRGHAVTAIEALPAAGGLLRYGIPGFKLAPSVVRDRIERIREAGVRFQFGTRVGHDPSVDDLLARFDAVFLGVGAAVPRDLDVEGRSLDGVRQAIPFLVRSNVEPGLLPPGLSPVTRVGRRVAVIGGGDTAMDCLRTALRLGASEATVWYRRTEEEMPGNPGDRTLAREEGGRFEWLAAPVRFLAGADGRLVEMECVRMALGEPDSSGRRRPEPVDGSEFRAPVDEVVLALGFQPDVALSGATPGLETDERGRIRVDQETGATTRDRLFAAGDAVRGPDLVATALADALRAADAIHARLADGARGTR
jgi:glutamate synthase (NADPH/NADH) small chain